jgi:hypothetical protein
MKLIIEIEMDNDAFDFVGGGEFNAAHELSRILRDVPNKMVAQLRRPASLCDAPEAADKLLDINGNTVGSVRLEKG